MKLEMVSGQRKPLHARIISNDDLILGSISKFRDSDYFEMNIKSVSPEQIIKIYNIINCQGD